MKGRVRSSISIAGGSAAERARALDDFNWAEIQTFHAFCSNVLRQYPLESGVSPDFDVLEEPENDAILHDAMEELFHSPRPEIRQSVVNVLALAGVENTEKYLFALYNKRFLSEELFDRLLSGNASERWKQEVANYRDEMVNAILGDVEFVEACSTICRLANVYKGDNDAGAKYLLAAEPCILNILSGSSTDSVCNALLDLSQLKGKSNMGSKSNFEQGDLTALREAYVALRKAMDRHSVNEALDLEDDQFIDHAVTFLGDLRAIFSEFARLVTREKRARNGLDFTDLLIFVRDLFVNNENFVKRHYADRYRYILVDEMQDTDVLQLDIIRALIRHSKNSLDKLFVVGDPKQSIYQFRDVDVSLFKETESYIISDLSGEMVNLDVNFRSAPQPICFVNCLFSRIMSNSDRPWEFGYDKIKCSKTRKEDVGSVELLVVPDSLQAVERKMAEAEIVARRIHQLISGDSKKVYWDGNGRCAGGRPVRFGDVCILLRARTNLQFYEHAFKKHNIPYHVHSGVGFYNSQEVIDAYNLLRFLDDPNNDVALLGLLRSPFFGISDADIFRAAEGRRGPLFWRLGYNEEARNSPKIVKAIGRLEQWLQYAHRETVSDLLARAITESQIAAVFAGIPGGEQKIANLEKLQTMIRTWQQSGFVSVADVTKTIGSNIREETKEGDAVLDLYEADAVRIMTVHAAKGLEFPIVFIPEIDRSPSNRDPLIHLDRQYGIGLKIPDPTGSTFRKILALKKIEASLKEKRIAEEKRLFYVATTRAKDHLIMSGQLEMGKKGDEEDRSNYWMSLLIEGLSLDANVFNTGSKEFKDGEEGATISFVSIDSKDVNVRASPLVAPTGNPDETLRPLREGPITVNEESPKVEIDSEVVRNVLHGKSSSAIIRKLNLTDDRLAEKLIKELDRLRTRFLNCDLMNDVVSEKKEATMIYNDGEQDRELQIDRLVTSDQGELRAIRYMLGRPGVEEDEMEIEDLRKLATYYSLNTKNNPSGSFGVYLYFAETGEIRKIIG